MEVIPRQRPPVNLTPPQYQRVPDTSAPSSVTSLPTGRQVDISPRHRFTHFLFLFKITQLQLILPAKPRHSPEEGLPHVFRIIDYFAAADRWLSDPGAQ
ncbi:hypothetical protein [Lonsdalea quercina]|uniref:hypothetical protein n=1 Tax=Lonsdalea quercina TaxID=71657 RepID=UPI0039760F12